MKKRNLAIVMTIVIAIAAISGCDVYYVTGHYPGESYTDDTVVITEPIAESEYHVGDALEIAWEGGSAKEAVDIDLYRYGTWITEIAGYTDNGGSLGWTIPSSLDMNTEVFDMYQIVVSNPSEGEVKDEDILAVSDFFTILPASSGGLSDVEVDGTAITITVTDNGAQIDDDTIDVYLNGEPVVLGHVLVGDPGTSFGLTLMGGNNVLEVRAINEGSVSPNTALLEISNVVSGLESQEWRLLQGEWGRLTIEAP